jgi:hypothetical protein
VKMDPRVTASPADLNNLFQLESRLAGILTDSSKADLEAHSAREQIEKLSQKAAAEARQPLESQDKELDGLLNGKEKSASQEGQPGLDDVASEAQELYGQVGQADAAPTAAQQADSAQLATESKEVLARWQRIKSTSLPALNGKLSAAGLPTIDLTRKPENMPQGGDED